MLTPTSVLAYRLLGGAGTALLAVAGCGAGALPVPDALWWTALRHADRPALAAGYAGLTLLTLAWWWAGRDLRRPGGTPDDPAHRRGGAVTLACWAAPLLLAPPMFSRDVYSYLAQGAMVLADLDVYRVGVAHLGGHLAVEVPQMWQQTPAPYGPVFLSLAAGVSWLTGGNLALGVLTLRLVAVAGVALLVINLPALAQHCGVDPAAALWLGVLNPLVPLHLVAGAHNEAVMLGLLVLGLRLALADRFGAATVLVTFAALVKVPALLGLLVVGALAARRVGVGRAVVRVAGLAVASGVTVTWASGIGYGWIDALATPVYRHSWSISTALGRGVQRFAETLDLDLGTAPMRAGVLVGLLGLIAVAVAAWHQRHRLGPPYAVGLVLLAVALLGPATRPWYALWGLVLVAAAAPPGRLRQAAALAATVLAFAVLPSGFGPDLGQAVLAAAGVLVGLAIVGVLRLLTRSAPLALAGRR
ncbi:polyprenol phosphomannose-dependent alpha 1,6 mannosyltransferase MptB [Micromonospora sp. C95]|uniref:polyprenol phosphomannose-dependent alpha 1,6 mannosyltransferase MptB n=1 Tax=Micromonospora sp. C95 TaxID=2824882 RepID=UPI0027DE0FE6|nr:polyprenol phosphomannose-dependent alpha 1,6 mannosyltransferase MptB [Micromonospora sp. C95]